METLLYKCPKCGSYMSFKMIYVAGTPSSCWYCASCGYDTSKNKDIKYDNRTYESKNPFYIDFKTNFRF